MADFGLKIEYVGIDKLTPYVKNAKKHPEWQVEQIAKSIEEFGMNDPIAVWGKKLEIVEGHGRLLACKELGYTDVPIIRLDYLTDEQRKAYTLVHNKLTMNTDFDLEILNSELESIASLDMSDFGFDLPGDHDIPFAGDDDGYFGDAREATYNAVNLRDFDPSRATEKWGIPTLKASQHVPEDLISFNYVLTTPAYEKGVHFYIDDYQFERVWNRPHEYIEKLKKFDCVLTPDFSMYTDMPLAMQLWNVYRSRLIGQIMQDAGIEVIPTLQWCREDSFEFCFDGIEPGGAVSVSTIGVKKEKEATDIWIAGMNEAIKRLNPSFVIVYGGDIGYEFPCEVKYIDNHNADRLKKSREAVK